MHYVLDPPNRIHVNIWIITVRDLGGSLLGCITRKEATDTSPTNEARFWFEDSEGKRLGEIRDPKDGQMFGSEVHGPSGELKGRIKGQAMPKTSRTNDRYPFDPLTLEDASGRTIAMSDPFVFGDEGKFEHLRKNNLSIKAPSGAIVANVHGADPSKGLQVDLYSSSVDRLPILALITMIVS
jgi:hypothetical protein